MFIFSIMTKIIQFLGGIVTHLCPCVWVVVNSLVTSIFNRHDCERFNIDNIEVRTGRDIPAVTDCDCKSENMTKTSVFTLDTSVIQVAEYREKHKFIATDSLYIRQDSNEYTKWKATLNHKTAELSFILHYIK